jgi:DNA-binding CsgD family transcriptional regulator
MVAGGRGLLLEREAELDRLRSLLGRGAVAVLTGPPGIGKTWLARALREEAEAAGHRVLAARGAELERDYGFGVVRQWFEASVRGGEPLEGAAALASPVLLGEAGEGRDASFSVLHGLYWFAAGLALKTPLLLVLDDAQWSDEASLRFAGFLARRLEGLPVLLLLTSRAPVGGAIAELAADPAVEALELAPLGLDAVVALLRARTDGQVDEAFALACREATGGNPFLLGELAQALLAEDVEFVAAERGRVPAVGPSSVAMSVQLRLARLPPTATRLARAVAVTGDDAPFALVAALASLDEREAESAADELARAGVLDDARPLRFVHPIVAAAIRESLLAGERHALHARTAGLLAEAGAPASAISVHLLALEPAGDAGVVATLVEAAEHALGEGAPESAARLLERALAEPPEPGVLPHVLLALGEAEHVLDRPSATERLREAHRLGADPRERARAALLLTWAVMSRPLERRDVGPLLERSGAELADSDPDLALRLEAARLGLAWDRGDFDAILEHGGRFAGLAGDTPGECLVLATLAHAWLDDGRPASATLPLAERAARIDLVYELTRNSIFLVHTGGVFAHGERLDLQLALTDASIAEAQARGSLRAYLQGLMTRSAALYRSGDVAGAEADGAAVLEGSPREAVFMPAVSCVVSALAEQRRFARAASLLDAHGIAEDVPGFRHGTLLLHGRARLREAQGDLRGALADLLEVRRRLDAVGRRNVVGLDVRLSTASIRRALGEQEEAEHEAQVALEVARAWGTPGAIGTALHATGIVHGDVEALREAADLLGGTQLRLRHAKVLLELGSMLRRAGARADSREPLREALALADELGAIGVRERAREELAASGMRIRREAAHGAEALTPSERRIVERAAAGASNPEIAQALFVTVKTVEMHLSNAYRKLDISGRRELAGALTQRG